MVERLMVPFRKVSGEAHAPGCGRGAHVGNAVTRSSSSPSSTIQSPKSCSLTPALNPSSSSATFLTSFFHNPHLQQHRSFSDHLGGWVGDQQLGERERERVRERIKVILYSAEVPS